MSKPSDAKKAEWLGLLAVWEMKYAGDTEAARAWCERLIKEYPQSPQAFAAQRRLKLMEMEEKLRRGPNTPVPVKPAR